MAHLLGVHELHCEFPNRVIFNSVTIGMNDGDRIGVVGRNGDGKSTLLSLMSGRLSPTAGRVTSRSGLNIGVLSQTDVLDSHLSVRHTIVGDVADHEWAANPRIRNIVDGLVSDIDWDKNVHELSGGQKRRVALAAVLVEDHDCIFLDEPTNHLDIIGVKWLAEHLKNRWSAGSGGLMVITHDRWFLDEVCATTWEVHDQTIDAFDGGYAAYILQRAERDRQATLSESKRQNLLRKELAWLRRGAPARTSKPKFRIEAANQIIANEPPPRDTVSLTRMAMTRLGKEVVDLQNVSMAFNDVSVLIDINWNIGPGERTGILGANGAGKSTLLKIITDDLASTSGLVKRGKTIKIATLTQHSDSLEEFSNQRIADVIANKRAAYLADGKNMTPAQLLERLGFSSASLSTPIKDLSGGQKRRLQLLLILLDEPNVLIMDEPTNDLDTDMLAATEDLLDSWPGTLLIVSHDRYFVERVTDQQYAIIDGHLRHLPGGIEQYLSFDQNPQLPVRSKQTKETIGLTNGEIRNFQKEIAAIERKLAKLNHTISQTKRQMEAHDHSDYDGIMAHAEKVSDLEKQINEWETRWVELSELLE